MFGVIGFFAPRLREFSFGNKLFSPHKNTSGSHLRFSVLSSTIWQFNFFFLFF